MYTVTGIFSIIFLFYSNYNDLTIDSKNRILFLSSKDRIIKDKSGEVNFSINSMFAPVAISSSSFSIWVTSYSESKSQKYSLWDELLGEIKIGGNDIDSDEKGVLITGEESYLVQALSGEKITLMRKEIKRCTISKDSLYLYGKDTLHIFKRNGKLVRKKFVPGVKDICMLNKKLCFLFNDSLVLNDTVIPISGGKRVDGNNKFVAVLSDSGIVYYPPPNRTPPPSY
jgi:hypothetical protein